jgi:stress response protein YsnF
MDENDKDVVIPVIREEVHADAVPVVTGGVRVTKRIEGHDEIVEQALQKSHVEVKRVKTERIVDGPQPVQHVGNTVIVPVVSEVLKIEKQWVVTEEIHITQLQERETVRQKVTLNEEQAQIERLDSAGNVTSRVQASDEGPDQTARPAGILQPTDTPPAASKRKILTRSRNMIKNRRTDTD